MSNIGQGRALRVCDICGQVDDHPRHGLVGGHGDYVPPTPEVIAVFMAQISPEHPEFARLLSDLFSQAHSDRHMDCCRSVGCPSGACNTQTAGAENLRGAALLEHLVVLPPSDTGDPADVEPPPVEVEARSASVGDVVSPTRPSGFLTQVITLATLALLFGRVGLFTRGLSQVNTIQAWFNVMRGTTFTGVAGQFVQLHTGDPGASGTANVSSVTTRPSLTWAAPSGSSMASSNTPQWTNWAGTNGEVITDISIFSASSAGTFYQSIQLTASKTVNTGDTVTLTSVTMSQSPTAA